MKENTQKPMLVLNDFKGDDVDTSKFFKKQSHLHVVPENENGSNQITFVQVSNQLSDSKNPGNSLKSKAPRFKYAFEKNTIPGPGQYDPNLDLIASDSPFNSVKKGQGIFKAKSRNLDLTKSHTTSIINPSGIT